MLVSAALLAAGSVQARIAPVPVSDPAAAFSATRPDPAEPSLPFLWQTLFESDIAAGAPSLPDELFGEPADQDDQPGAQPSSDVSTSNLVE
jgi:hypothetical protein